MKTKTSMSGVVVAFLLIGLAGATAASAEVPARPTFTKDILPIFQQECQICHRPAGQNLSGMVAPMALMTYREVRPWAKAIAKSVQARTMPPWTASKEFNGIFRNERTLTDDEIATIVNWGRSGAPQGKPSDAPVPIEWPESGWTIGGGTPDIVVSFDEPNWVGDEVDDLYQNITVKLSEEQMPEDKWLQAIEFKPGSEVVHHIIAYASGVGEGGGMSGGMLGGEAPGTDPSSWPDGFGIRVPKTPRVSFQMHYHKEAGAGTGVFDSSSFAMKWHEKPVTHPIRVTAISHGAFEIPPGNGNWKVGGARTFKKDTIIMGFMPHMHLRGVAAKYTAYYPDGTSEVLLDVPKYDFNWQIAYDYKEDGLKSIPAGTRVEFEMWYDNSIERATAVGYNGNRPVSFGGPTWDEMDLGWMNFTDAEPVATSSD